MTDAVQPEWVTAKRLFDLAGKVAVVSGAAQGLGRATAIAVGAHGADVALVDCNREGAEATAAVIEASGVRTLVVDCNVFDPGAIADLFQLVDRTWGRVDFLGNVVGCTHIASSEIQQLDDLERLLKNFVVARFAMCQEAGRRMLAQRCGSIMNIGSIAGMSALGRGHLAYGMANAAITQMTRELSTEWGPRGVRVNCVIPAQILNPSLLERKRRDPLLFEQMLQGIPLGRFGQPHDLMGLAVLLASDASSWMTGAVIALDGGNLAMNPGGTLGPS